tara:strand:+ start:1968 stop:2216 length:249 start_codon:yes stop_codon:yes gene_type:complete
MPNDTKVILILLMILSFLGVFDMSQRIRRGKVLKELQNIGNPSKLTQLYIKEYKHFFELSWWHWLSIIAFGFSIVGIIIDSY